MKIKILTIMFVISFTYQLFADIANYVLLPIDFSVSVDGITFIPGENYSQAITNLSKSMTFSAQRDIGSNVLLQDGDGISLSMVSGYDAIYSIVLSSKDYATHRGVSVGDSFLDVSNAYPMVPSGNYGVYRGDETIVIQQQMFRKDNLEYDSINGYFGEMSKIMVLTFHFVDDVVSKITINWDF